MALRDLADGLHDVASIGLVLGKQMVADSLADVRDVEPGLPDELVERLHPRRVPGRVAEIIEETASTRTLRLVPVGEPFPPFRAGQFFALLCEVGGVRTSRAYSVSSPPTRSYLDITVRKMPSGFVSVYLCEEAAVGDVFELSGPGGSFYHEPMTDSRELVFLAGGSGVTPFMSMVRSFADLDAGPRVHLVYGSRTLDDVIFEDELAAMARTHESFRLDLVISEPPDEFSGCRGFLDAPMLSSLLDGAEGKTFFICGPHAMYGLCTGALEGLGVSPASVKKEASGPPPDITLVEGWPKKIKPSKKATVRIEGTRSSFEALCGEPLLNSLERNGVAVENLCRSGECGVCRSQLVSGEVFMPASVVLRKADVAFGYIHPCMSYPLGDITIRL
ncbi:MAG: 2Fe-2S iron-sulfur cluster binding domain-containing protein [Actinobacteria bacterium]|nr:2Fe-2S iron-sulfur cluster binding domain-containing protein [Actinomycetota bacterium]MBU1944298.1 2Fe-2S iron-sulfur cluster binding domain-containing protein [Actinomycetota bacterium]MBU2688283.1 2Fe-2S iron-sulfur cluster binding domain-containing protein [Actinomycetota bacterium]